MRRRLQNRRLPKLGKSRVWPWAADRSPKFIRFQRPEAAGWLTAVELGEEGHVSSTDISERPRGTRR